MIWLYLYSVAKSEKLQYMLKIIEVINYVSKITANAQRVIYKYALSCTRVLLSTNTNFLFVTSVLIFTNICVFVNISFSICKTKSHLWNWKFCLWIVTRHLWITNHKFVSLRHSFCKYARIHKQTAHDSQSPIR